MTDLYTFDQYNKLADMLIEQATKEQLAECARLLSLNLAHHQSLHGEIPLDASGKYSLLATIAPYFHITFLEIDRLRHRGQRLFASPVFNGAWDQCPHSYSSSTEKPQGGSILDENPGSVLSDSQHCSGTQVLPPTEN